MNPFLTIPISLPGVDVDGTQNPDKVVDCKILPGNVSFYHEGYAWGTFIYMQNGQAICSPMTVKEFEEAVRLYWLEVGKLASKNMKRIHS